MNGVAKRKYIIYINIIIIYFSGKGCHLGSQVGVVVIIRASHLYDPGSILGSARGLRFVDLNLTLRVFLPLQIRLSRQDLSHRTIKH